MVHSGSKSFFVVNVKSKQDIDPILMQLKSWYSISSLMLSPKGKMGYLGTKVDYVFQVLMG